MREFVAGLCFIFILTGCEKNIDFDLKNADNVLVVDASIENDKPPVVVLTRSFGFFSTLDLNVLANSFVHNASVSISNGSLTHRLKEYSFPLGAGYSGYAYGIDSADLATAFLGQFDKKYDLDIKTSDGKSYAATTTIPVLSKTLDSIWWKPAPFAKDTADVILMVKSTDPPGLGNYIRYFTKINSGNFLSGSNSVFDDQVIDGTTYTAQVDPGVDRNNLVSYDSNYFKRGDTITLKLCNIDKATYTFWSTWEFAYQSIGNPFAQPNKVIGNISNGALGDFYGYAAFYSTFIVPK